MHYGCFNRKYFFVFHYLFDLLIGYFYKKRSSESAPCGRLN